MQISFRVSAYYGLAEKNLNCFVLVAFAIGNATRTTIILCSLLNRLNVPGLKSQCTAETISCVLRRLWSNKILSE